MEPNEIHYWKSDLGAFMEEGPKTNSSKTVVEWDVW